MCAVSSPFYTVVICLFEPSKGGYGYRRSGRDKYGPPTRTEYRLIVENLSSRCSWQDLKVWASSTSQIRLGMGKSRKQAIYAGLGIHGVMVTDLKLPERWAVLQIKVL